MYEATIGVNENETTNGLNTDVALSSALYDTDALNVPEHILFPDELNRYLRDRIQHLTQQNGMLQKKCREYEQYLSTSQSKIEDLNKKLNEYQNEGRNGFVTASNASCNKIAELSKKLREKTSEMEGLKSKYSKLEKLLKQYNEKQNEVESNAPEKDETPKPNEVKTLKDKLSSTYVKLFDVKNQNVKLKNDLKLATKLLQQETGESFESLQNVVNLNPNWRGRAQVISDLQQKVTELKDKLKEKDTGRELNKTVTSGRCRIEKRSEVLMNENKELREALEENKRKLEATKARCKVLELECNNIRTKLSTTSSKHEKDHELITSLMSQMSTMRDDHIATLKQKQGIIERMEQTIKNLTNELSKEKTIKENLKNDANVKEAKKNETCKDSMLVNTNNNNQHEKLVMKLEAEKIRLLDLLEITNSRLEKEREAHAETQNLYRAERQRTAILESKVEKLQLEFSERNSVYSGHSSMHRQVHHAGLEDQLQLAKENIKALQTRLALEKEERKRDFMEFSKILQSYRPSE